MMSDNEKDEKDDASAEDSSDEKQNSSSKKSDNVKSGDGDSSSDKKDDNEEGKSKGGGKDKDDQAKSEDGAGESSNSNDGENEEEDEPIKVERTQTNPALLSQLRHSNEYHQARGLGAGGTGAATFKVQRITALALIPLAIWFAVSVVRLSTATQGAATAWLAWPVNAAVMAVFIVIALRHAVIGLQIILEDYVDNEGLRAACVLVVKAIALVLGIASVAALIHLAL